MNCTYCGNKIIPPGVCVTCSNARYTPARVVQLDPNTRVFTTDYEDLPFNDYEIPASESEVVEWVIPARSAKEEIMAKEKEIIATLNAKAKIQAEIAGEYVGKSLTLANIQAIRDELIKIIVPAKPVPMAIYDDVKLDTVSFDMAKPDKIGPLPARTDVSVEWTKEDFDETKDPTIYLGDARTNKEKSRDNLPYGFKVMEDGRQVIYNMPAVSRVELYKEGLIGVQSNPNTASVETLEEAKRRKAKQYKEAKEAKAQREADIARRKATFAKHINPKRVLVVDVNWDEAID